jgi:hypothetical protein
MFHKIRATCGMWDRSIDLKAIDSANVELGAQRQRGLEPQIILIILSCGLMDIEKREDGLQVTHTAWS